MKETMVLYHANCTDGFGGAYAAWRKFGDNAEYIPVFHGEPFPENLENKEVFIIDFSYDKETNLKIKNLAKHLTIIDHHKMRKEDASVADECSFDTEHSGAYLAWKYFHTNKEVPKLIQYIQEGDLYRFKLPHSREILAVINLNEHSFESFQKLERFLESKDGFEQIHKKGVYFVEHWNKLVQNFIKHAEKVSFEGYEVLAVHASGIFHSDIGNILAKIEPPFGIIWSADTDNIKIGLRSKGEVDVAKIAKKYGGGGHPNASGFRIKYGEPFPFKKL